MLILLHSDEPVVMLLMTHGMCHSVVSFPFHNSQNFQLSYLVSGLVQDILIYMTRQTYIFQSMVLRHTATHVMRIPISPTCLGYTVTLLYILPYYIYCIHLYHKLRAEIVVILSLRTYPRAP